jgi:hypothetical protein
MCESNTDDIVTLFVCFFVTTDVASGCEKAVTEMGNVGAVQKEGFAQGSNSPTLN